MTVTEVVSQIAQHPTHNIVVCRSEEALKTLVLTWYYSRKLPTPRYHAYTNMYDCRLHVK